MNTPPPPRSRLSAADSADKPPIRIYAAETLEEPEAVFDAESLDRAQLKEPAIGNSPAAASPPSDCQRLSEQVVVVELPRMVLTAHAYPAATTAQSDVIDPVEQANSAEPVFETQRVDEPIQEQAVEAEAGESERVDRPPQSLPFRMWRGVCSGLEWLFGLFCLWIGLAVLATVPVVQVLSLGYLLEVSGRVSRSGRLRDGFVGVRKAARVGRLLLGTWLMWLPLRFMGSMWYSAYLIDPYSRITVGWRIAWVAATVVMAAHVLLAWYCGGRLRHFFWPLLAPLFFGSWLLRKLIASHFLRPLLQPIVGSVSPRLLHDLTNPPALRDWFPPAMVLAKLRRGDSFRRTRDAVWQFMVGLRLPHYFWLGARGFAGAVAWLLVPIVLLIAATKIPDGANDAATGVGVLLGLVGAFLLSVVLMHLPFLQANFAAERRMAAMFDAVTVYRMFYRAPVALWFALLITLLFALPLYILKIENTPREVAGFPAAVFVAFIFPARLLTGWAVGRARKPRPPRFLVLRWLSCIGSFAAAVPVVGMFVLIVYITQYLSWYGSWSMLEQHAFLVPAPFLGM